MDIKERIRNELDRAPVVLFMKGTPDFPQCGFSAQTSGALRKLGVGFHSVNIFEDPEMREAPQAVLELADLPAAVSEGRVAWWVRYHDGNVPER